MGSLGNGHSNTHGPGSSGGQGTTGLSAISKKKYSLNPSAAVDGEIDHI